MGMHGLHNHLNLSFDEVIALVVFMLSITSAAMKVGSLLVIRRSATAWEASRPNKSAGFRLRARASHESLQIAPWHPVDRLTWAHSAEAKREFKAQQAATAVALRAAADAADHADGREVILRQEVAAERRASFSPELVQLGIAITIACLSAIVALT